MYKEMIRLEKENSNLIGQICAETDHDKAQEMLKSLKRNAETLTTMREQEKHEKSMKRKGLFKRLMKKS